jgi:hypothetical protein
MPFLYRLSAALLPLLILLDVLGMAGAGGVLVYRGFWQSVWTATLVFFISPLIFPYLLIPAAMCGGLMRDAKPWAAKTLQAGAVGWIIFLMALWAAIVFELAAPLYIAAPWAVLTWSVCGSVAPWAVFARSDRGNYFFLSLVLTLQLGCLLGALASAEYALSFPDRFGLVAGTMIVFAGAQAVREALKK